MHSLLKIGLASLIILFHLPACLLGQYHMELIKKHQGDFERIVKEMEQAYVTGEVTAQDYKRFHRWRIYAESHLSPTGHVLNAAAKNIEEYHSYLKAHPELTAQTRVTHGLWSTVSPSQFDVAGPINGRLNCIAVDPTNTDIIYVGAALSGLWKTTNGGSTWTCLTDGLPVIGVSSIAINPLNTNNIYILTGDGDGTNIPSIGILESFDAGLSWSMTGLQWNLPNLVYGHKLLMNPNHPDSMFVATNYGLYRTSNGWLTHDTAVVNIHMVDIEFKPGSTHIMYASSAKTTASASVFLSTDSGVSWTNLAGMNGLPNTPFFQRIEMAISPNFPAMVVALYAQNDTFNLYRSFNSGDMFSLISTEPNIVNGQVGYDLAMAINPSNYTKIFVGGVNLWRSTNTGLDWTQIANGDGLPTVHADIHAIHHDGSRILVATDGGISKSLDDGTTWSNLTNGMNMMQYYYIDMLPSTNSLMGGSQDNGTQRWDIGDVIGDHILGSDGMVCIFHPTNVNLWYASSQTNRWRWNGSTWSMITPPNDTIAHWESDWLMHPTHPDTLYAGWVGNISRTYNRGIQWFDLNPGFTDDRRVYEMAQGINNSNWLYACDQFEVLRTTNLHATTPSWSNVTNNLPIGDGIGRLGGMAISPTNANHVWATKLGYQNGQKIYFSDNGGTSWTNISGSLPNVPVHCIEYQPGSNDGIYIGTDLGVFYRNADMNDWIYFSNGLPTVMVKDIKIKSGYIFAGTFGRGIWRSDLYSTCPVSSTLTPENDPSSANSTGIQHYSASQSIFSTRIITGGPGSYVTYQAGNYVQLNPGFHAKTNNELLVKIEGCPD